MKGTRFSSLFNLVITWGRYPTPHVGMLNRVSNLKKTTFTNVGISVSFIHSPSFHKWSHLHVAWVFVPAIAQHTKEEFTFSHTYKTETKKIKWNKKTQETILRKPKEGKKENQQEKKEINKIFKNYWNKKQEKNLKIYIFFFEKKRKRNQKNKKVQTPKFFIKKPFQITRKRNKREI